MGHRRPMKKAFPSLSSLVVGCERRLGKQVEKAPPSSTAIGSWWSSKRGGSQVTIGPVPSTRFDSATSELLEKNYAASNLQYHHKPLMSLWSLDNPLEGNTVTAAHFVLHLNPGITHTHSVGLHQKNQNNNKTPFNSLHLKTHLGNRGLGGDTTN